MKNRADRERSLRWLNLSLNPRSATLTVSVILALAATLPAAAHAQTNSSPDPNSFVVRVSEAMIDNEHGVTRSDCVLVLPDGRLHLERRRVAAPSSTATLKVYESSLDSSQLEQLRNIVNNEVKSGLPEYDKSPVGFQNAPWFSSVIVDTGDRETARRFGYWAWDKRNAGPDVPADVKKQWQESEVGLRPLVEWLHGIEGLKLPPSDAAPTQCSADGP